MRFLLFIFTLLLSGSLKGQYIPLHIDVGTCWNSIRHVNCNNSTFSTIVSENTSVIKDTVIIGHLYYKIQKHTVQIGTANPNPPTTDSFYLLRNDTLNMRVYSFENGLDSLLYDFNLNIGDVIPRTNWIVDTVGVKSIFGITRKFYGLKNLAFDNYPNLLFYEGIGENRSIFALSLPYYDSNFAGAGAWIYTSILNCGYQGIPLFGDSIKASTCYPLSIDNISLQSLLIYPNPVTDIINIDFKNFGIVNIQIIISDINGKIVYKKSCSKSQFIECSNWHRGIYFLCLTDGNKMSYKKILIE